MAPNKTVDRELRETERKTEAGMTASQRQLLNYYRHRLDHADEERNQCLERLEKLEGTRTDNNELRHKLQTAELELQATQKALSDAHVYLYNEREQALKLAAENDELRIQDIESRKRIQHLLALTKPLSQEVSYFPNSVPHKLSRDVPVGVAFGRGNVGAAGKRAASARQRNRTASQDEGGSDSSPSSGVAGVATAASTTNGQANPTSERRVLRTIFMPNEGADVLKLIIDSLRTQLEEQSAISQQHLAALMEDRDIREAQVSEMQTRSNEAVADALKRAETLSQHYEESCRDYLQLRKEVQERERVAAELVASSESDIGAMEQELLRLTQDNKTVTKRALAKAMKMSEQVVGEFRQQAVDRGEVVVMLRDQYAVVQQEFTEKMAASQRELAQYKKALKTERTHHKQLVEGYGNDVKDMRSQVQSVEAMLVNLKLMAVPSGKENVRREGQTGGQPGTGDDSETGLFNNYLIEKEDLQRLKGALSKVARRLNSQQEVRKIIKAKTQKPKKSRSKEWVN